MYVEVTCQVHLMVVALMNVMLHEAALLLEYKSTSVMLLAKPYPLMVRSVPPNNDMAGGETRVTPSF
jgi:hypothetical protein